MTKLYATQLTDSNAFSISNILKNIVKLDDVITKSSMSLMLEIFEKYTKITDFGTENIVFCNLVDAFGSFVHSLHRRPTLPDD